MHPQFSLPVPAVFTAPMAGVTDAPFRMAVTDLSPSVRTEGEMISADPGLLKTEATKKKVWFAPEENRPRIVQLLGADPAHMAAAARFAEKAGADILDINMGCPAKKICRTECGSALMKNLPLAEEIIRNVMKSTTLPVTLKMRAGWDAEHRNAPALAAAAEQCGVSMITVHGRTRMQGYSGRAEYETVRRVKAAVSIPVIANGDIDSPGKALRVIEDTQADGIMVGRAALGAPWLMQRIAAVLAGFPDPGDPDPAEQLSVLLRHFERHIALYGSFGLRTFRKQLLWYLGKHRNGTDAARHLMEVSEPEALRQELSGFYAQL